MPTETVSFALDGTSYEIDLSEKNADELRDAFAKYVGAARKAGRSGGASGAGRPPVAAVAAAPRWTATRPRRSGPGRRSRGCKVSDRGRIPASIIEQYDQSA